jgi:hypothetical protein
MQHIGVRALPMPALDLAVAAPGHAPARGDASGACFARSYAADNVAAADARVPRHPIAAEARCLRGKVSGQSIPGIHLNLESRDSLECGPPHDRERIREVGCENGSGDLRRRQGRG